MGKYSDFERNPRDFYSTPLAATLPLHNLLARKYPALKNYIEPFCGDGRLIGNLNKLSDGNLKCVWASDIEPQPCQTSMLDDMPEFHVADYRSALDFFGDLCKNNPDAAFISNPPWINTPNSGLQLNDIIMSLSSIATTCLLLDANYAFNKKSVPMMKRCSDVVPVGRVKWIDDSPYSSKENVAWFIFQPFETDTTLHARQ